MADILSILAIIVLFVGCLLPVVNAYCLPSEYSPLEKVLYAPVYCVGRLLWRIDIDRTNNPILSNSGVEEPFVQSVGVSDEQYTHSQNHDRKSGIRGAVIVANHRNSLDPFFIQLACGRRVHWMVASEYFKNPVFGLVLRTFQAIPTNRSGADSASMKTAIRLASEGQLVGMFPEGRINRTQKPLLKIRTGAGLVASKANCPLVPCWIEGAPRGWDVWSGWFTASHIKIALGKPLFNSQYVKKTQPVSQVTSMATSNSSEVDNNYYFGNLNASDELTISAMRESLALGGNPSWPVSLVRMRLAPSNG